MQSIKEYFHHSVHLSPLHKLEIQTILNLQTFLAIFKSVRNFQMISKNLLGIFVDFFQIFTNAFSNFFFRNFPKGLEGVGTHPATLFQTLSDDFSKLGDERLNN